MATLLERLAAETRNDVREIRRLMTGIIETQARHDERLDSLERRPPSTRRHSVKALAAAVGAGLGTAAGAVYAIVQAVSAHPH